MSSDETAISWVRHRLGLPRNRLFIRLSVENEWKLNSALYDDGNGGCVYAYDLEDTFEQCVKEESSLEQDHYFVDTRIDSKSILFNNFDLLIMAD